MQAGGHASASDAKVITLSIGNAELAAPGNVGKADQCPSKRYRGRHKSESAITIKRTPSMGRKVDEHENLGGGTTPAAIRNSTDQVARLIDGIRDCAIYMLDLNG